MGGHVDHGKPRRRERREVRAADLLHVVEAGELLDVPRREGARPEPPSDLVVRQREPAAADGLLDPRHRIRHGRGVSRREAAEARDERR